MAATAECLSLELSFVLPQNCIHELAFTVVKQVEMLSAGIITERGTPLSRRLALQQRVDAKPVAVHQQIRREMQMQVICC